MAELRSDLEAVNPSSGSGLKHTERMKRKVQKQRCAHVAPGQLTSCLCGCHGSAHVLQFISTTTLYIHELFLVVIVLLRTLMKVLVYDNSCCMSAVAARDRSGVLVRNWFQKMFSWLSFPTPVPTVLRA